MFRLSAKLQRSSNGLQLRQGQCEVATLERRAASAASDAEMVKKGSLKKEPFRGQIADAHTSGKQDFLADEERDSAERTNEKRSVRTGDQSKRLIR